MAVETKDSYFKSHDQHRLFYQSYHPKKSKAVVILVHGLNEHIGRYDHVVGTLTKNFTVYLFDHRGHGRSDGVRSHVVSFSEYCDDLHEFVKLVKKNEKNDKVFIIGHSMGGQVLLNYLHTYPKDGIAGFVTSSANIRVGIQIGALKKYLGYKLSQHFPKVKLPNDIDPKWISRDKNIVAKYKADPLVSKSISVRLATEILDNQEKLMSYASKIKFPALMLHGGDDRICDPRGTEEFYQNLKSNDKELKIYDGMYHEIFNEIGREEVIGDVNKWILKHV